MMPGMIQQTLMKGESVQYQARIHPVVFMWTAIWSLLWISASMQHGEISNLAPAFFFIGAITGLRAFLFVHFTEFAITDHRLIYKRGF